MPTLQQLDDDILHLLWGVAGGKVFLQTVVADRDLALQRLFLPHNEVDDVIFQLTLAAELLEPLSLSQRRGYLIALHDQQEVGLFFFGQVGEEIRRGNELERSCVHCVQQRRDQLIQAHITLYLLAAFVYLIR